MVVEELRSRVCGAIQGMRTAKILDDRVLMKCLYDISSALLQADVSTSLVKEMERNIMMKSADLKPHKYRPDHQVSNKATVIQRAIFGELCKVLDPGKPAFTPRRREPSVVLFVGLRGSGKTTSCVKYARYHHMRGYSPALVCADTFKVDAYDQLKQNAVRARIPFHGSYTESDPAKIAAEGIEKFRKEGRDLIIVDTSGRHTQEATLFEETRQLVEAMKPHLVVFVVDSRIGQTAIDQATAFKRNVAVGAVILSKLDGHTKGGGALSAVALTKSPIIFVGTGEHIDEFEVFDVKPFVCRLMGVADRSGLDKSYAVVSECQQHEPMGKHSQEAVYTLRSLYKMLENRLHFIPCTGDGESGCLFPICTKKLHISQDKMKRYMRIMDSMTSQELDRPVRKQIRESRVMRIARGSGQDTSQVMEMMQVANKYKRIDDKMRKLVPERRLKMTVVPDTPNQQERFEAHLPFPLRSTRLADLMSRLNLPSAP